MSALLVVQRGHPCACLRRDFAKNSFIEGGKPPQIGKPMVKRRLCDADICWLCDTQRTMNSRQAPQAQVGHGTYPECMLKGAVERAP